MIPSVETLESKSSKWLIIQGISMNLLASGFFVTLSNVQYHHPRTYPVFSKNVKGIKLLKIIPF